MRLAGDAQSVLLSSNVRWEIVLILAKNAKTIRPNNFMTHNFVAHLAWKAKVESNLTAQNRKGGVRVCLAWTVTPLIYCRPVEKDNLHNENSFIMIAPYLYTVFTCINHVAKYN